MHNAQVMSGIHLHVRTWERADVSPFPYLVDGWTNCAEIWYMVDDPLARRFTEADDGIQLHVRTCAPFFRISRTGERIVLKFGMWLETH